MPSALTIVTPPAVEPVLLAEAKDYLRVTDGDSDVTISNLLTAARLYAETFTRRALITQTWKITADSFPSKASRYQNGQYTSTVYPGQGFLLPMPPAQSVTSITYYDADNTLQTLSSSLYQVDALGEPARVIPNPNSLWPTTYTRLNAVTLTYVCGYGASGASVPQGIRQAILILTSAWFDSCDTGEKPIPMAVSTLLMQHRFMGVA